MDTLILSDLLTNLPPTVRLQRLVNGLRAHFCCGAVAVLQLDAQQLRPIAVDGLMQDALGRRYSLDQHPRLAAILSRRGVTCFHHDSGLPDPYDGLIDGQPGAPLPVHDCMGISLHIEGRPWGVLTLDALRIGTFDADAREELHRLSRLIETAVRTSQLEGEILALRLSRGELRSEELPHDDGEIIGQSPAINQLLHELDVVADSELPVLLLGETGVGKELFARRLHRRSRRRRQALVHINCAALPESLAESELFGHAKGAFSGALSERAGRFEAASGGTLFLDEVGELPQAVQAKLLRTLQNGEIQRLGEDRPRRVDVRIIAATNRQLRDHVRNGSFRADLYHRLSVYPIPIPPLRERDNDVLLLAGRFLELNRARLGLRSLRLSHQAQEALRRYAWPGNVRELEHAISRAALKAVSRGADRNKIVTLEIQLLDLDELDLPIIATPPMNSESDTLAPLSMRQALASCQRGLIQQALSAHDNNWARAARQLDIDSSNLHKLARRLGIKP